MTDPPRSTYQRAPGPEVSTRPLPAGVTVRPLADEDDAALGRLMELAYAGTIDEDLGDNSDGVVEIADWRTGGPIVAASFVVVDGDGRPVSASLATRGPDGRVWIGYVFTDPAWKGRGLGAAAVAGSVVALSGQHVSAGVTDGNTPSERLLSSLGFVRIGPA